MQCGSSLLSSHGVSSLWLYLSEKLQQTVKKIHVDQIVELVAAVFQFFSCFSSHPIQQPETKFTASSY